MASEGRAGQAFHCLGCAPAVCCSSLPSCLSPLCSRRARSPASELEWGVKGEGRQRASGTVWPNRGRASDSRLRWMLLPAPRSLPRARSHRGGYHDCCWRRSGAVAAEQRSSRAKSESEQQRQPSRVGPSPAPQLSSVCRPSLIAISQESAQTSTSIESAPLGLPPHAKALSQLSNCARWMHDREAISQLPALGA